jgi:Root hair defective 3 GTP-binding protein (RHD3)
VAVDPGAALVLLDFEGADGVEAGDSRIVAPTRLIFTLRDSGYRVSEDYLNRTLRKNVEDLWDEVNKPACFQGRLFDEFFSVEMERFRNKV